MWRALGSAITAADAHDMPVIAVVNGPNQYRVNTSPRCRRAR